MPPASNRSQECSAMTRLGIARRPLALSRAGLLRIEKRGAPCSRTTDETRGHRGGLSGAKRATAVPDAASRDTARVTETEAEWTPLPYRSRFGWNVLKQPSAQSPVTRPGPPPLVRAPWSGHGTQGRVSRPLTCSRTLSCASGWPHADRGSIGLHRECVAIKEEERRTLNRRPRGLLTREGARGAKVQAAGQANVQGRAIAGTVTATSRAPARCVPRPPGRVWAAPRLDPPLRPAVPTAATHT